ncbi:hypothetical protein V5O48_004749 [Marasmius crinis-equi]|uniref:Uncharacterized protein n=1 Tax=Marasmius crinis-equi TaxID=585013 RepID=A0ABR3FP93_9AGAR
MSATPTTFLDPTSFTTSAFPSWTATWSRGGNRGGPDDRNNNNNNNGGDTRGNDQGNDDFTGSIYLYTFLGVLLLLLLLSSLFLIRTRALRQRHRRMVEEAIRNGTYVPPPDFKWSAAPVMWEAWVKKGRKEDGIWEDIKPVSASLQPPPYVYDTPTNRDVHTFANLSPRSFAGGPTNIVERLRLPRLFGHRSSPSSSTLASSFTARTASTDTFNPDMLVASPNPKAFVAKAPIHVEHAVAPQAVRVSVLIAMPTPTMAKVEDWESTVPSVEVGSVDVDVDVDEVMDVDEEDHPVGGNAKAK